MYTDYNMPAGFDWNKITTNENIRNILAEELTIDLFDEDDSVIGETPKLTYAESHLLIDEYCKLANLPAGLYDVLSNFSESGFEYGSFSYVYSLDRIDKETIDYIKQGILNSSFAPFASFDENEFEFVVTVSSHVNCKQNKIDLAEESEFMLSLFSSLESIERIACINIGNHYNSKIDLKALSEEVKVIIEKAVQKIDIGSGHLFVMSNEDKILINHGYLVPLDTLPEHILSGDYDFDVDVINCMGLIYENSGRQYPANPAEFW